MTVPINHVGMTDIQTEFGGSSTDGIALTEYYRGGSYVSVNQLQSVHSVGPIPLLSNGATQEISIGMFRGLSNTFKWIFNITQDRYDTFNLYNELVAVGWNQQTPIDATINVYSGVYVLPQNTSSYAINASNTFPASSKLTINNNGFIFGRGGMGGTGGVFDLAPGANGQDGGTAICTNLRTVITNNGWIAGGGGGGGGGGAGITATTLDNGGENYSTHIVYYPAPSGGGGAPFGGGGATQSGVNYSNVPGDYFSSRPLASAASQAGVFSRGNPGVMEYSFHATRISTAGHGGMPGSDGFPGHNPGGANATALWGQAGLGGLAGYAIIGGQNVEWKRFGLVAGRYDYIGRYYNQNGQNILGTYLPDIKNKSCTEVYRYIPKTANQGTADPNYSVLTQDWSSALGDVLFSYNSYTNWADWSKRDYQDDQNIQHQWNWYGRIVNPICSQSGSPLSIVKYFAVVDNTTAMNVRLTGIADDKVTYVMVNGQTKLTNLNGILVRNTVNTSGSFDLPVGPCVVEVGVRDDNGGAGHNFGNSHMIGMSIKTLYDQVIIDARAWHVKTIENL